MSANSNNKKMPVFLILVASKSSIIPNFFIFYFHLPVDVIILYNIIFMEPEACNLLLLGGLFVNR